MQKAETTTGAFSKIREFSKKLSQKKVFRFLYAYPSVLIYATILGISVIKSDNIMKAAGLSEDLGILFNIFAILIGIPGFFYLMSVADKFYESGLSVNRKEK